MIGMRTVLEVADNSGARKLSCILPRGGDLGAHAGLGDIITAAVKEASPESSVKKGKVVRCVIVRLRKETRRKDGTLEGCQKQPVLWSASRFWHPFRMQATCGLEPGVSSRGAPQPPANF